MASPGPPLVGGGPSVRKNFGSLTGDRYRLGCRESAACSAVVPALGTPATRKSGSAIVPPPPLTRSIYYFFGDINQHLRPGSTRANLLPITGAGNLRLTVLTGLGGVPGDLGELNELEQRVAPAFVGR